jgi:hypothetical protein
MIEKDDALHRMERAASRRKLREKKEEETVERGKEQWKRWLLPDSDPDPYGWWFGWCPIHDTTCSIDVSTAQFNFGKGAMRCNAEDSCHAGKRSISLTNVTKRVLDGTVR